MERIILHLAQIEAAVFVMTNGTPLTSNEACFIRFVISIAFHWCWPKTFTLRSYCQRSIHILHTQSFFFRRLALSPLRVNCGIERNRHFFICLVLLFKQLSIVVHFVLSCLCLETTTTDAMMNAFSLHRQNGQKKRTIRRAHTPSVSSVALMALVVFSLSYSFA